MEDNAIAIATQQIPRTRQGVAYVSTPVIGRFINAATQIAIATVAKTNPNVIVILMAILIACELIHSGYSKSIR